MKIRQSLNGVWYFAPTHDQRFTNNHNVFDTDFPLYAHPLLNRRDWLRVDVPGVWQRYAPQYELYEGVCWYYRDFELDLSPEEGDLYRLIFGGVNYRADVYLNGHFVGRHESGYTEFVMDVSAFVQKGKNALAVEVDNRPLLTKWPNDWGYGVFGGIHREVTLEMYRGEYLYDVALTPDYDVERGCGRLALSARATAGLSEAMLCVGEQRFLLPVENGSILAQMEIADVFPWSADTPTLHSVTLSAEGVTYESSRIGFRHVDYRGHLLYLNGKRETLRGVCYVYDSPKWGLVMDRGQLYEDLCGIRAMGANAVRTHYPMSRDFYELCDEMGFLTWIEPNIYCAKPPQDRKETVFSRPEFVDNALSMTKEMIDVARKYASVVIWGIGNECNVFHPEARAFFEQVAKTVRIEDATRLVGYASLYGQVGCMADLVDVMGINSYFGWYGTFREFEVCDEREPIAGGVARREVDVHELGETIERVTGEIGDDTVLLLTEFGADSIPGYFSSASELWSENYHADVVRAYVRTAAEHAVGGTFVFAYTDYSDPSKPMNGRWNGYNLKGMVSYEREVKLPYYALKEVYEEQKKKKVQ